MSDTCVPSLINPRRACTARVTVLGLSLTLGAHASSEGYCSCPVFVCVCVSVRSFLPPRTSRPRNIGTYVFTATRKNFYNRDFR